MYSIAEFSYLHPSPIAHRTLTLVFMYFTRAEIQKRATEKGLVNSAQRDRTAG